MGLHVGFTGTVRGMTPEQKEMVYVLLQEMDPEWAHHGDCIGADAQFHRLAQLQGILTHGHPPINQSKSAFCHFDMVSEPLDYIVRNHAIVDAVTIMLATPGEEFERLRSGTWATVRYARKTNTDIYVVLPNGSIHGEGAL